VLSVSPSAYSGAVITFLCRAQILPEISADPSVKVINFCRTPQWYIPRVSEKCLSASDALIYISQSIFRYPEWLKWVFAHVPLVMRWYRNSMMARVRTSTYVPDAFYG
jgi:hypothetical protein